MEAKGGSQRSRPALALFWQAVSGFAGSLGNVGRVLSISLPLFAVKPKVSARSSALTLPLIVQIEHPARPRTDARECCTSFFFDSQGQSSYTP